MAYYFVYKSPPPESCPELQEFRAASLVSLCYIVTSFSYLFIRLLSGVQTKILYANLPICKFCWHQHLGSIALLTTMKDIEGQLQHTASRLSSGTWTACQCQGCGTQWYIRYQCSKLRNWAQIVHLKSHSRMVVYRLTIFGINLPAASIFRVEDGDSESLRNSQEDSIWCVVVRAS